MRLELARSAGFCYGVRRAVQMAEMAAEEGRPCVMLGLVDTPEEVPPGVAVLIRSHGEGRPVHEALARLGRPVIDATCPNVSRIHQIVSRAEEGGRQVLIIGTRTHPEVAAIAGWCRRPVVLEGVAELSNWLETAPERRDIPLTMVSQTTSTRFIWDSCVEKAKKECTNLKIFDTICNATCKRQSEAQALAARSDAMVVIGGRESSNTKRLAELCGALCPMVVWIERAAELEPSNLCRKASIGITAGASTPEWIIKEVYDKMSDENIEIEESFAEMLEKSIKTLNTGEKVTGVVTGITPTEIYVDLGTKHAGYIPVSELTDDPTAKVEDLVKIGDEIETYVMRVNDQEGVVTLSKKRLDTVKSWDDIEQAREEHTTVEGVVTEENKGGVVVSIKGVRVFVPASQTGLPRETPMSQLLKQHVRLRITEVNRARRRVVGSIRAVEAEERAAKAAEVWANIEENKRYTGTVKSLTSYGAFVDIGGVDGMVHISELSWEVFTGKYQPGDVANVRVVKLMTFGAFAEVVPGVDGLIHISQIADHRIDKPGDVLSEGQMVDVKIIDIDYDNKKVSLSIRALLEGGDEPAESEDVNEE